MISSGTNGSISLTYSLAVQGRLAVSGNNKSNIYQTSMKLLRITGCVYSQHSYLHHIEFSSNFYTC